MYKNIYHIDFDKLVQGLVPAYLRRSRLLAFLKVMVSGVVFLYQDFLRYRKQKLYELMITPQVCYLERLLNDRYDFSLRRIYILDSVFYSPVYFYQEDELKPVMMYQESENKPVYFYTDGEAGTIKDDFVIMVPSSIPFDQNEMRSLVNKYKLPGKRYKIELL